MASFVAPIIQGLHALREHKATLAAHQEQQKQMDLKKAVLLAVMHHIQNQGGK